MKFIRLMRAALTRGGRSPLEQGMDEEMQELAALDCWAAYSAAAGAIAGSFAVDNVPTERLRYIAATNTHDLIRFGAQIALHHRGADWQVE